MDLRSIFKTNDNKWDKPGEMTCLDLLNIYNNYLPDNIEDVDDFCSKEQAKVVPFFVSLLRPFSHKSVNTLNKRLYHFKIEREVETYKNLPINVLLQQLKHKQSLSNAKKELQRRFDGQEYETQLEILRALFLQSKITARSAIVLMHENDIWKDSFYENIVKELSEDKAISKQAKSAGIAIILRHASAKQMEQTFEFCRQYIPYFFLCIRGIEKNLEKSKLLPIEYLAYLFSQKQPLDSNEYSTIFIGIIQKYISEEGYTQHRDKKQWLPTLTSLIPSQVMLALAAKYKKDEVIKWFYELDRNIQRAISQDNDWLQVASGEDVAQCMNVYYSYVLDYFKANHLNGDISEFKLKSERINDNSPIAESSLLPF